MTYLRGFTDDEYRPEYATLKVRDAWLPDRVRPFVPGGEVLDEFGTEAQPCGSITRSGSGWLEGRASGNVHHEVRLEAHDGEPVDDRADWADVAELPYSSSTGHVGLTTVTGGPGRDSIELGPPGLYQVRVARRPADGDAGDVWRLQFWPNPGDPTPLRCLARVTPATQPPLDGWRAVLDHDVHDVRGMVHAAAGTGWAGLAEIRDRAVQHGRSADWLDHPLWPDPPTALPTGHADLDAAAAERRRVARRYQEGKAAELDAVAAALGLAPPLVRRDVLDLLVAAGLVEVDDSGAEARYRNVTSPARAQDVLDLPAERVSIMDHSSEAHQYVYLASDLVSVAMWSPDAVVTTSVAALAERLLVSEADTRGAIRYAARAGLIEVDSDPTAPTGPITLTVLIKGAPAGSRRVGRSDPVARAPRLGATITRRPTGPRSTRPPSGTQPPPDQEPSLARPKPGRPPLAGYVSPTGDVVVWRNGRPVVLARHGGSQVSVALESRHGIVLVTTSGAALIARPDGTLDTLATGIRPAGTLSDDGDHLAVVESTHGRRASDRLHLVALADGGRRTMPWDESRIGLSVIAVHAGAVYFGHESSSLRWIPGGRPEALPYRLAQIDPLTGNRLVNDGQPGVVVIDAEGGSRRVAVGGDLRLAPGGIRLYSSRGAPPAVSFFDVAATAARPTIHWLPEECDPSQGRPYAPIWEDRFHLLIPTRLTRGLRLTRWPRPTSGPHPATLRLHVETGGTELVTLADPRASAAVYVRPWLRPDR